MILLIITQLSIHWIKCEGKIAHSCLDAALYEQGIGFLPNAHDYYCYQFITNEHIVLDENRFQSSVKAFRYNTPKGEQIMNIDNSPYHADVFKRANDYIEITKK